MGPRGAVPSTTRCWLSLAESIQLPAMIGAPLVVSALPSLPSTLTWLNWALTTLPCTSATPSTRCTVAIVLAGTSLPAAAVGVAGARR